MKKRLNDRMVERLKTPEKGRVDIWDSLAPGLFLVLRPILGATRFSAHFRCHPFLKPFFNE